MPITIRKEDNDIKFYGSQTEPILVIYSDEKSALLNYCIVDDIKTATEISEATMIAGLFIDAILNKDTPRFKTNNIEALYFDESDMTFIETKYSSRKILNWLKSDAVITVNKKEKIRYKFTKFSYQNGKLVIFYRPVAW